jgi:TRAP-type C4-dicarboxylate transport system permease small subunit
MNPLGDINPGTDIPTSSGDFTNILQTVFTIAYSIAGVAAFGYLVYGGYKVIMSTGDPQKMKEGIDTVGYALIGLVIVISSAVIFNFIANRLGLGNVIGVLDLPTQ